MKLFKLISLLMSFIGYNAISLASQPRNPVQIKLKQPLTIKIQQTGRPLVGQEVNPANRRRHLTDFTAVQDAQSAAAASQCPTPQPQQSSVFTFNEKEVEEEVLPGQPAGTPAALPVAPQGIRRPSSPSSIVPDQTLFPEPKESSCCSVQ